MPRVLILGKNAELRVYVRRAYRTIYRNKAPNCFILSEYTAHTLCAVQCCSKAIITITWGSWPSAAFYRGQKPTVAKWVLSVLFAPKVGRNPLFQYKLLATHCGSWVRYLSHPTHGWVHWLVRRWWSFLWMQTREILTDQNRQQRRT